MWPRVALARGKFPNKISGDNRDKIRTVIAAEGLPSYLYILPKIPRAYIISFPLVSIIINGLPLWALNIYWGKHKGKGIMALKVWARELETEILQVK